MIISRGLVGPKVFRNREHRMGIRLIFLNRERPILCTLTLRDRGSFLVGVRTQNGDGEP